MSEKNKKLAAQIEALLFIYGEPIEIKRIKSILSGTEEKVSEAEIKEALLNLENIYKDDARGINLIFLEERVGLATKPSFGRLLEDLVKAELTEELTPAALETLSIVAYTGPTGRSTIDYVRGVNSTFILRMLLLRGLIERKPDPERQNAYLYGPSFELLKYLGVARPEDLPDYSRFRDMVRKLSETSKKEVESLSGPNSEIQ